MEYSGEEKRGGGVSGGSRWGKGREVGDVEGAVGGE